ncbi:MAG: alpha/beta fold hydrolase, partial [Proteobacteria bacterium]|nr:alpha/beta fold hydrolase [Pseudomonadota bacterium]
MSDLSRADSVGLVIPEVYRHEAPFALQCGVTLESFELVYETYGELNDQASNAVLVCHALSGHHHAAGFHEVSESRPGWWDNCIGPGKPIDTRQFYVVSLNNLGGCHGSTGPCSINPRTGSAFGPDFPLVTVSDWVRSQTLLADDLAIRQFAAIIGGSLGGMQAMQWAIDFPDRLHAAVLIACASKLSAQNIAFNEIARQAILTDPEFHDGKYREQAFFHEVLCPLWVFLESGAAFSGAVVIYKRDDQGSNQQALPVDSDVVEIAEIDQDVHDQRAREH